MTVKPSMYYPNTLGLNGGRVSVYVDEHDFVSLYIGTRLCSFAPIRELGVKRIGDVTTVDKLCEWAVDVATALESAYARGYKSMWEEYL